jgi:predicted metal-binding membrane protein
MNLAWVAALTIFVLIEKTRSGVRWVSRIAGYSLSLAG